MKFFVVVLLTLAAALKTKGDDACECQGEQTSMSASMSQDVSVGGPQGHYAAHKSASISQSAGPDYQSMSASVSQDVSINKCGNHLEQHHSASVSRSVGEDYCSMSASETNDLSVETAAGQVRKHSSTSVSKSVGNGYCSTSESTSNDLSVRNAEGHLQTHTSTSVSNSVENGRNSMSASVSKDVAVSTAGGRHATHFSASVSRSAGKGYMSMSASVTKDETIQGPCGERNEHLSTSISRSISEGHRSMSASMSHDVEIRNGNCYRKAHNSASVSQSIGKSHQSLSQSQSSEVIVRGPNGYQHIKTSSSLSRSEDQGGHCSVSGSTSKSVSFAGKYGHGHFHKSASFSKTKEQAYERGSNSLSTSYSASGVRNGKHWSVSTSLSMESSYAYGKGYAQRHGSRSHSHHQGQGRPQNLFVPKCCNPCNLLKNPKSNFYENCGQFLSQSVLDAKYTKCMQLRNNKQELEEFLGDLKNVCYNQFITLVNFECLPVELPKFKWGTNDKDALERLKHTCDAGDYSPPEETQCDRCEALVNTNSQFYQVCGHAIDEDLRQLWYMKCRYSVGHCHWNIILSMIIGYCHSINPNVIPDFCAIEAPTTTTTTTTTANPNCPYDGGVLEFGAKDVLIKGCTEICSCTVPGVLDCRPTSCAEHAECQEDESGDEQCVCTPPYEGDGFTCMPPPIPICVGQKIDLVFVVDTSASISLTDFEKMKKFVKEVIMCTDVGVNSTLVGIIRFSQVATLETYLGEYTSKAQLLAEADTIFHDKMLTYTDMAVAEADKMLTQHGRTENTKPVVIIVTDGKSTDQVKTVIAMKQFRDDHPNATVIVVGVTNSGDVDESELRMLATGVQDEHVLTVNDYDTLLDEVDRLANETCNVNNQPPRDECEEILYYYPDDTSRWYSHYGVYDKVLGEELCNGESMYVHTSYRSFLQWDGTNWVISQKPCRFDEHVQTLAKLIYAPGTPAADHHVVSETGDVWNEPADEPTFNKTVTVCF